MWNPSMCYTCIYSINNNKLPLNHIYILAFIRREAVARVSATSSTSPPLPPIMVQNRLLTKRMGFDWYAICLVCIWIGRHTLICARFKFRFMRNAWSLLMPYTHLTVMLMFISNPIHIAKIVRLYTRKKVIYLHDAHVLLMIRRPNICIPHSFELHL